MTLERPLLPELFLRWLTQPATGWAPLADEFLRADEVDVLGLLNWLCAGVADQSVAASSDQWENFFSLTHNWLVTHSSSEDRIKLPSTFPAAIARLYQTLGPECRERYQLLVMLALSGGQVELGVLANLLCVDPPRDGNAAAAPFVPLLHPRSNAACMFPKIANCLENPNLATPLLDLANYLSRENLVPDHPLQTEVTRLERMLEALTAQFEILQENPEPNASQSTAAQLGIGMIIALTHALALIQEAHSIRPLSSALGLKHRRIRVEVAAALASLGDATGKRELLACAADPSSRLRAVHYASELDLDQEIDNVYVTDLAMAEARFVSHLSQPNVMGVPPKTCRLVDQRTLYWPGFDDPQSCFLFEFSYLAVDGEKVVTYKNIGIAGPVLHVLTADLLALTMEDVYAAYAGWQAEHSEIRQEAYNVQQHGNAQSIRALIERADQEGYSGLQPTIVGSFFGDCILAATAVQAGQQGSLVIDDFELLWIPSSSAGRSISDEDAYFIYKGRRLLSQFNDPEAYPR